MDKGYFRVHLIASDGDWITLYVPLTEQGNYDKYGRAPHLLKTKWAGYDDYGELTVGADSKMSRIIWSSGTPDFLTDLLLTPLHQGAVVRVYEGDDETTCASYTFTVKFIDRL